ncbi:phosphotriesterase family protein [Salmonirosea aquatica]|uniref:Phosphotriesterase n=1 Tax=Salmonirosea aquatica TaxID=2654236 RepID=A0A7C9FS38_9BACT|nr:phosphotriesterase [Cytophagaceae bacterium SJW1-29]
MKRRIFLYSAVALPLLGGTKPKARSIQTVLGAIPVSQLGMTLIHEHILVDFIGADKITPTAWDRKRVLESVMPYLEAIKQKGVRSFVDCTPSFLGRDVELLREISLKSGLNILTNTGYYGAADNKYLPKWAFTETDEQLAARWIREFEEGIEGTNVRPGFIKIGVNSGNLSELHQKLVRAAAITHLATGLTICSHTGPALPAFQEIELLGKMGVSPRAFVWVHAQNETDKNLYTTAARQGAWVSLDGIGWGDTEPYAAWIAQMKSDRQLNRLLISHDAGWYRPEADDPMAKFVGYTQLFDTLIPLLSKRGLTRHDIDQLLVKNPAKAFGIIIWRL